MEEESWSARRGQLCINTRMQTIDRDLDRRLERFLMTFDVYTPTRQFQLADEIVFRTYTNVQFGRLLASTATFEVAATFDFSYRVDAPTQVNPSTEDVVYVLRKR
jgi:hypothetical protein